MAGLDGSSLKTWLASDFVTFLMASTALTTALAAKAPLASPTFSGTPAGPTAALNTATTQFATTAFVEAALRRTVALTGATSVLETNPRDVWPDWPFAYMANFTADEITSFYIGGGTPVVLDRITIPGCTRLRGCWGQNGRLYVTVQGTSGSQKIGVINIENPSAMAHVTTVSVASIDTPVGIIGSGRTLLVTTSPSPGPGKLIALDISNRDLPVEADSWTAPGTTKLSKPCVFRQMVGFALWEVPVVGTDAFHLMSIADPWVLTPVADVALPSGTVGADCFEMDDHVYVAREDATGTALGGFVSVDCRDLSALDVVGDQPVPSGLANPRTSTGITGACGTIYTADKANDRSYAYDVSGVLGTPAAPVLIKTGTTGLYQPAKMTICRNWLLVANRGNGSTVGGGLGMVDLGGPVFPAIRAGGGAFGHVDVEQGLRAKFAQLLDGLGVGGSAAIAGGLAVGGLTDLLGDLNVGGDADVAGDLTVTGNVDAATFDGFTLGSAAELDAAVVARAPVIPPARWLLGEGAGIGVTTGIAPGADSIRLYAVRIRRAITISELNARVTTAAASGNFQIAIYAAHATSLGPTGAPLYSSSGFSTTSTGAAGPSGLSVALTPGVYWFALLCDTSAATAAFTSRNPVSTDMAELVGGTTITNVLGSGANLTGFAKSHTYGTWPTLTGVYATDSLTDVVNGSVPLIAFKV